MRHWKVEPESSGERMRVGSSIHWRLCTDPHTAQYWGDLTGEPLDPREVAMARELEIEYFKEMGVHHKVPMSDAKKGDHKGVRCQMA